MKQILILSIILVLFGCRKKPIALFSIDDTNPIIGQTIAFTNQSVSGLSYSWSFGDGTTSILENPTHIFTSTGNYTVTLTAYSKKEKKLDEYSLTIPILKSTTQKMSAVWTWDSQKSYAYINGTQVDGSEIYLADTYTIHTREFRDDLTYEAIFNTDTIYGAWSVWIEGNSILLNGNPLQILDLTDNTLKLLEVDENFDGTNTYNDTVFSEFSR